MLLFVVASTGICSCCDWCNDALFADAWPSTWNPPLAVLRNAAETLLLLVEPA